MSGKEYWQGVVEANMRHTTETLDEIKKDVKAIKGEVHSLSYFKAKVYGFAAAWSFLVHYAMKKIS